MASRMMEVDATEVRRTEKAVLLRGTDGMQHWIPLSATFERDTGQWFLAEWIVEREELDGWLV